MKNEKIVLISFVAMICVVMQHCCCGSTIEDWFVPMFTTWAVPWFFVVSWYFFYGTVTKKEVVAILTSKVRTLLIPYVIWRVFGAVLFCECTNSDVWGVICSALLPYLVLLHLRQTAPKVYNIVSGGR